MSNFLSYNFNNTSSDVDLATYVAGTGESGGAWAPVAYGGTYGYSGVMNVGTDGRVFGVSTTGGNSAVAYLNAAAPPTANYTVAADFVFVSNANAGTGLLARFNGTTLQGYFLRYSPYVGWSLVSWNGGTQTVLTPTSGTMPTAGPVAGLTVHVVLTLNGTALSVALTATGGTTAQNAAQTASVTFSDTKWSGAGQVGLYSSTGLTDSTGVHIDNLAAAPVPVATLAVTGPSGAIAAGGTLALGNVVQGSAVNESFTVNSTGSANATVGTVTYPAGLTATTDPSGTTINAGSSGTLAVRLNTATAGAYSGTISIPSNDAASPYLVHVTATVIANVAMLAVTGPAGAVASGGTIALGTVTQGAAESVALTVNNTGSVSATLGTLTHSTGIVLTTDPSGGTVASLGSTACVFIVPTGTVGPYSGSVSIPSNDPANPFVINITATVAAPVATLNVVGPAGVVATGGTVALGNVYQNVSQAVTLTINNAGTGPAALGTVTTPVGGILTTNPSGAAVTVGGSAPLVVSLSLPSLGSYAGSLTIPSNDPAGPYVVNITATVVATPFLLANFNNTAADIDLASYSNGSGEIGGAWHPVSIAGGNQFSAFYGSSVWVDGSTGRVRSNSSTSNGYYNGTVPPSPDYTLDADFVCVSANALNAGLLFRFNPSSGSGYALYLNYSGWSLYAVNSGSLTALAVASGSAVTADVLAVGQTVHAHISVTGALLAVTLTATGGTSAQNAAQSGSWSCNDTTYTTAGNVGVYFGSMGSDTAGIQIDNVAATNLGTPNLTVAGPGGVPVANGSVYNAGGEVQNASASLSFALSNVGGGRASNLKTITYTGCTATADPSNTSIAVGGTATVTVTLPTGTLGTFTPSISVVNDSAANPFVVNLAYTVVACNPSAPAGAVTGYAVTGGATSGDTGIPSTAFTVALAPASPALSSPVVITPSDGNRGGTFTPPSVVLGTNPSSATFTYTPPLVGAYTLSFTNNAGLSNPSSVTYTAKVQVGATATYGTSTTPDFGGFELANCGAFAELFRDISNDPVDPNSATWMGLISSGSLHPDFGSGQTGYNALSAGIPFSVVPGTQPKVAVTFNQNQGAGATWGGANSDAFVGDTAGCTSAQYPFPAAAPIEGFTTDRSTESTGDQHCLVYDRDNQLLYETWSTTTPDGGNTYDACNGAVFDMKNGTLRPADWTSGDAAGLPILPLLLRYDEAVLRGVIPHALRVTFQHTGPGWVYPARHVAGPLSVALPMGARLRLTAAWYNANAANFTGAARVVVEAMRHYGLVNADNGSNWFFQGASDSRWNMPNIQTLATIPGTAFEIVQVKPSFTLTGPTSLQVGQAATYTLALYPPGDIDLAGAGFHVGDNNGWSAYLPFSGTSTTFTYTPRAVGTAMLSAYDTNTARWPQSGIGQPVLTASAVAGPATTYDLAGPAVNYGTRSTGSGNFTASLQPGTTVSMTITVTPSDGGSGGSFNPAAVALSGTAPSATFTYTPTTYGPKSIATTNNGGLADPPPVAYSVGDPATTYTPGATLAAAKFPVSLPANTTVSAAVTVTPASSGGGTFYPATAVLTNTNTAATFTFSPATTATTTISFSNTGGLANPSPFTYTPVVNPSVNGGVLFRNPAINC